MTSQASFTLPGRNPDVLTCIANLSNDEVFTPPELANRMLDMLAATWAADHNGANLWADRNVKFLDPFTKSGVFLREITKRLTEGLKDQIPDLQERVDHILTRQVFGIAITQLTSLLARRSLYCSKFANGKHSIARGFTSAAGNIWFERMEHTWKGVKCRYCSAPKKIFDRGEGLETHAYAFIHTDNIQARVVDFFGGAMQFDVIIGNPPYQMTGGGGAVATTPQSITYLSSRRCDWSRVTLAWLFRRVGWRVGEGLMVFARRCLVIVVCVNWWIIRRHMMFFQVSRLRLGSVFFSGIRPMTTIVL